MRITRVFFETHMGLGFEGLNAIAKKARSPITDDTTMLFINTKMTAFKMFQGKSYIVYYKNNGKRIPIEALRFLPQAFGGSDLEMNQAIRRSLSESMGLEF